MRARGPRRRSAVTPWPRILKITGWILGGILVFFALDLALIRMDRSEGPRTDRPGEDRSAGFPGISAPPFEGPIPEETVPEASGSSDRPEESDASPPLSHEGPSARGPTQALKPKKTPGTEEMDGPEVDPEGRSFTLQVGSFVQQKSADRLVKKLRARGYPAYLVEVHFPDQATMYRVRVGSFSDKRAAKKLARRLAEKEGLQSFIAYKTD